MQETTGDAPLRLAYIIDTLVTGGAERLVVTFAQAVQQRTDIALTVIVLSEGGTPFHEALMRMGADVVCLPGKSLIDGRRFLRVLAVLRARRIAYVHAHLITSTVVGGFAAAVLRIPFATTIHNVKASTARVSRVRGFLYRRVLRMARTTRIAVGQAVAEAAQADTGGRSCLVVPNAVAPDATAAPGTRETARAGLGVQDRPVLLAVGAIIGQKAYGDLLAAFAQIACQVPEALLLIAGNAPEPERLARLQQQARDLGIAGSVQFLGLRRDIPALLAAADVFISASHWEGAPVSLLEAMANGLPCVMTDVGDNRRILAGTGLPVVPAGQPGALAEAAVALLRSRADRQRASQAVQARAAGQYGVAAWAAKLTGIYRGAGAPPPPDPAAGPAAPSAQGRKGGAR